MSKKENHNTIRISDMTKMFLNEYSKVTTLRTTPGPNLNVTAESVLRAVDLAVKGSPTALSKIDIVDSYLAEIGKVGESSFGVLARMTSYPFPLLTGGKIKDLKSSYVQHSSLINALTGKPIAPRYSRVGLSELGVYATRHHRGAKMNQGVIHKSFVPISLICPTMPFTLGFKSEMHPLNPGELFSLMVEMINHGDKELPDETIQKYFRGIDLGKNYIVCCKSEGLMYLYGSGKGIFTVIPKIEIDRQRNMIRILAPRFKGNSKDLKNYFLNHLRGLQAGDPYAIENDLKSFSYTDIGLNGGEFYFKNVRFNTNNDMDILNELWAHKEIKNTVHVTNTSVDPETLKKDIKPVKDVLWKHILDEEEMVTKEFRDQLEMLKEELFLSHLLEKVTRPQVAEIIKSILTDLSRESKLTHLLGEDANTPERKEYLPEGFTAREIALIWSQNENIKVDGLTINILSILPYRKKYEKLWIKIDDKIKEILDILNNPYKIREIVRRDIESLVASGRYVRQSTVKFLAEQTYTSLIDTSSIRFQPLQYIRMYDRHRLPVTLFYSDKAIFKNYGKNMNIISYNIRSHGYLKSGINCMNDEKIAVFYNNGDNEILSVASLNHATILPKQNLSIKGIIPLNNRDKYLLMHKYDSNGRDVINSYMIYVKGGTNTLPTIDKDDRVVTFIEVDNNHQYIDLILRNCTTYRNKSKNNAGIIRLNLTTLPKGYVEFPQTYGIVTDMYKSNKSDFIHVFNYKSFNSIDMTLVANNNMYGDVELLPNNILPISSKNLEIYYKRYFVNNLQTFGIVTSQYYRYPKKFVLTEKASKHILDIPSLKFENDLAREYIMDENNVNNLLALHVTSTVSYDEFKVSDIPETSWSLLDKAFGLPAFKPEEVRHLALCDAFMDKVFRGSVNKKDTLPKVEIKAEEELAQVNYSELGDYKDKYEI